MTDRVKGFTVTLDKDIRIDDIEDIQRAIEMIKHVAHVEPRITTHADHTAIIRVNGEMRDKLYKFVTDNFHC